MNSALAFELYRGVWFVDGSESTFKSMLHEARTFVPDDTQKLNTFCLKDISAVNGVEMSGNSKQERKKKIAVTNISGVVTRSGGSSSRGMEELSAEMLMADQDPDVIGHLVKFNTPGGSEPAMRYMKVTLASLTKPKVTMVVRQGMAASAGLGMLVEGDFVMAESADAMVGSHGVMWGTSGVPNGQKDAAGEVNFVVISDGSPDKNKATQDAINNNDTSLMKKEVNELYGWFASSTKSRRPNVKDEHLTGAMYKATEVVGSLIDAIGTEADAVNKILELSNTKTNFKAKNKNPNKTAMTAQEFKSQHPEAYAEIYGEGRAAGMTAERERVKSWQHYASVDPELVKAGIMEGREISASEREGLLVKIASGGNLANLQRESAANVVPPEAQGAAAELSADEKDWKAQYPNIPFPKTTNAN
jgi:ClpP class serine protease